MAGDPGAGDLLGWLPAPLRGQALRRLGYGTVGHADLIAVEDGATLEWWWVEGTKAEAEGLARMAACPWPVTTTTAHQVEGYEFEPGHTKVGDVWVPTRRVVRAPEGTPIPSGWTMPGEMPWLMAAPWPLTADEALSEWTAAHDSVASTVVLSPRSGGVEVYRGVGGRASSLGVFRSLAVAWEQVDADRPEVPEWITDAPPRVLLVASGPGWDAVEVAERHEDTPAVRAELAARFSPPS